MPSVPPRAFGSRHSSQQSGSKLAVGDAVGASHRRCSTDRAPLPIAMLIPAGFRLAGFCAICKTRPFQNTEIVATLPLKSSGMNAAIHETVHCIAAEPKATFLRVGVIDGRREVAYETAVLGRLRGGYRVLHLRSIHGTRQELCYLFVRISVSTEPNYWQTPRQIRLTRSVLNLEDHIGIVDRIRNQERG